MWQTDPVTLQTKGTVAKVRGATKVTWVDSTVINCDVQHIDRDFVFKKYGLNDAAEYRQIYDLTLNSGWVKGNQVKIDGESWWVRVVSGNRAKMGASNHVFIIVSRVI